MLTKRIYYGWWIVGVLVLTTTIVSGTGFYSFGVFIEPLMADFGWSKARVTSILTVYWMVAAVVAPLVGRMVDRFGIRRVMVMATLANGLCLFGLSRVTAIWQFYLLFGFKAVCHAGIGLIAIGAITAIWFDKKRGRATGIATTGIGFGGLFLAPYAGFLIPVAGWRAVFLSLSLLVLLVVLPLVVLIIKPTPQSIGLLPDGEIEPSQKQAETGQAGLLAGFSLAEAMKMTSFWLIMLGFMLAGACVFGMLAHQTSYLEGIGISRETASVALGITAGIGVIGKIVLGWLAERFTARVASMICFAAQLVGVWILMMTQSMMLVWVYALVFGFFMGGVVTLRTLITIDYFGPANIGAILGVSSLLFAIGAGLGPLFAALIFDQTNSYRMAFLIYMAMYATGMLLIAGARKTDLPQPSAGDAGGI